MHNNPPNVSRGMLTHPAPFKDPLEPRNLPQLPTGTQNLPNPLERYQTILHESPPFQNPSQPAAPVFPVETIFLTDQPAEPTNPALVPQTLPLQTPATPPPPADLQNPDQTPADLQNPQNPPGETLTPPTIPANGDISPPDLPTEAQIPAPETQDPVNALQIVPREPAPSDEVGPSKLVPGMTDSCTQIEPGELHFPMLILSALPPHLLQYSMGGNPYPEGGAFAEGGPALVLNGGPEAGVNQPPQSIEPVAEVPTIEAPPALDGPSQGAASEGAIEPVPYLVRRPSAPCSIHALVPLTPSIEASLFCSFLVSCGPSNGLHWRIPTTLIKSTSRSRTQNSIEQV
jgi:hypothetical protein